MKTKLICLISFLCVAVFAGETETNSANSIRAVVSIGTTSAVIIHKEWREAFTNTVSALTNAVTTGEVLLALKLSPVTAWRFESGGASSELRIESDRIVFVQKRASGAVLTFEPGGEGLISASRTIAAGIWYGMTKGRTGAPSPKYFTARE